ncbi:MAG: hypothetical protein J7K61_01945 [Thermoplasmata archaeon]|nr:hypothetical protein [Thermoplasmata archaeon]
MKDEQLPEEFTRNFLIEPLIKVLRYEKISTRINAAIKLGILGDMEKEINRLHKRMDKIKHKINKENSYAD